MCVRAYVHVCVCVEGGGDYTTQNTTARQKKKTDKKKTKQVGTRSGVRLTWRCELSRRQFTTTRNVNEFLKTPDRPPLLKTCREKIPRTARDYSPKQKSPFIRTVAHTTEGHNDMPFRKLGH